MKKVYLDHAATTHVKSEVLAAMLPVFGQSFGNASSIHAYGREARKLVEDSRERVAKALGAKAEEIYFTSGGTESDNLALKGVAFANQKKGKHIITSAIEHHAVLHTCQWLEKQGFEVTYLPVDEYGRVRVEDFEKAIRPDTILASIMFANNEVGTIEPIEALAKAAHAHNVIFHTDAVQAVGQVEIDVEKMGIDLLSMSGHKIYGPKGVGVLYVKKGIRFEAQMLGGEHERRHRAGTENVPGIVGLATALELATEQMPQENARLIALRDRLIAGLSKIPYAKLNGHPTERLPNNMNMSFSFIEGEGMLLSLDLMGIAASSGSACTSGSLDPSHVLLAMGLNHETAHGSLRLSLGSDNTQEDIDYVIDKLPGIVERLRQMSPLYTEAKGE